MTCSVIEVFHFSTVSRSYGIVRCVMISARDNRKKWHVSSNKGESILRRKYDLEIAEASAMFRIWEVHHALENRIARWTEAARVSLSDAAGCIQMRHSYGCIILRGSRVHLPPLARRITLAGSTGWCIPLILNLDAYAGFRRSRASVFGDCEANRLL